MMPTSKSTRWRRSSYGKKRKEKKKEGKKKVNQEGEDIQMAALSLDLEVFYSFRMSNIVLFQILGAFQKLLLFSNSRNQSTSPDPLYLGSELKNQDS